MDRSYVILLEEGSKSATCYSMNEKYNVVQEKDIERHIMANWENCSNLWTIDKNKVSRCLLAALVGVLTFILQIQYLV